MTVDRARLREVMQMGWGSGYEYYLDRQTGRVVSLPEGIFSALEEGAELRAPWREFKEIAEEVLRGTGRYIQIPVLTPDDIFSVLADLASRVKDEYSRRCLAEALASGDYIERFEELCAFDPELYEMFSEILDELTDKLIEVWLRKNGLV